MHADMMAVLSDYSSSSTIHVATADCEKENSQPGSGSEVCSKFNLSYFPYIIYGHDGQKEGEYQGDRSEADMQSFIESKCGGEEEDRSEPKVVQPVCEKDVVV